MRVQNLLVITNSCHHVCNKILEKACSKLTSSLIFFSFEKMDCFNLHRQSILSPSWLVLPSFENTNCPSIVLPRRSLMKKLRGRGKKKKKKRSRQPQRLSKRRPVRAKMSHTGTQSSSFRPYISEKHQVLETPPDQLQSSFALIREADKRATGRKTPTL